MRRSLVVVLLVACAGCGAKATSAAVHERDPDSRELECPLGQIACDDTCTDVATNPSHCGGCAIACAPGQECRSGKCAGDASCSEGMVDCNGECRNLSHDPEFCGRCGTAFCNGNESCWNGACVCRPELSPCGMDCYDTQSNPAHCGDCETLCHGLACARGACVEDCAAEGLADCDRACVDLETSPLHCGGCGHACAQDQVCLQGACWDYEPAIGCASCAGCTCPEDERCCDLVGYGVSCVDTREECPEPPAQH